MKTKASQLHPAITLSAVTLFAGIIFTQADDTIHSTPALAANDQHPPAGLPSDIRINAATGMPMSRTGNPTEAAANSALADQNTVIQVRELIAQGQYDEALQRCLSFHGQLKDNRSLRPLLSDWVELGRRFPKARESLIEIRDHDVREFSKGRGYSDLFSEINSINGYLNQPDATYALFQMIRDRDPELAQQCYFYVESLLVARGEYQWCYDHMGDPQGRFDAVRQASTLQRDSQKRMAEMRQRTTRQIAEMNQKLGRTNFWSPPDPSAMMKKSVEDGFVGQTRQLIEILVATGHKAEAEKIRDQAVSFLDDARLKSSVSDAEQNLAEPHRKK